MSDENTSPTTYGERRVRNHMPGSASFDDPYWWRELGKEIDDLQQLAINLWRARRRMACGPNQEKLILKQFPWIETE